MLFQHWHEGEAKPSILLKKEVLRSAGRSILFTCRRFAARGMNIDAARCGRWLPQWCPFSLQRPLTHCSRYVCERLFACCPGRHQKEQPQETCRRSVISGTGLLTLTAIDLAMSVRSPLLSGRGFLLPGFQKMCRSGLCVPAQCLEHLSRFSRSLMQDGQAKHTRFGSLLHRAWMFQVII